VAPSNPLGKTLLLTQKWFSWFGEFRVNPVGSPGDTVRQHDTALQLANAAIRPPPASVIDRAIIRAQLLARATDTVGSEARLLFLCRAASLAASHESTGDFATYLADPRCNHAHLLTEMFAVYGEVAPTQMLQSAWEIYRSVEAPSAELTTIFTRICAQLIDAGGLPVLATALQDETRVEQLLEAMDEAIGCKFFTAEELAAVRTLQDEFRTYRAGDAAA
jgi:hypothetical protein